MRKRVLTILALISIISGLGFCLFPTVSNNINKQIAISKTEQFDEQVKNAVTNETYQEALEKGEIDDEGYPIDSSGNRVIQSNFQNSTQILFKPDLDRLYQDSVLYNENLKENQGSLLTDSFSYVKPTIDLTEYGIYNGVYGYITAPTIDMKLPIYLGANDDNMSCGAAHLTYTSLPIGGEKTNTVLAGHTGYVGRIFFDNIHNLQIGDEVSLTNYWYTIYYKVIEKEVYAPNQSQAVYINDDRDLLTMITCVSDGNFGFNRYYVICERK